MRVRGLLLALSLPVLAVETPLPGVTVSGVGFHVAPLDEGSKAFANRDYVWKDVPGDLRGWEFTQFKGGERAELTATAPQNGKLLIATPEGGVDLAGWERYGDRTFRADDKDERRMLIYARDVTAGERVKIPQGNWWGTSVLAPAISYPPPGHVIDYSPAASRVYLGSPSLLILPDGSYLASHDFFGPGSTNNVTRVLRSTDKGVTWQSLTDLQGQWWSSLFQHHDATYLLGVDREMGNLVIRRSRDSGRSWTTPRDEQSGVLARGSFGGAPSPTLTHNGRLWHAVEAHPDRAPYKHFSAMMLSASDNANVDLLKADSWTHSNQIPFNPSTMLGEGWLEGNAVVSPDGHLLNILRVEQQGIGKAAVARVSPDGKNIRFDPAHDYMAFPSGDTKFGIRFDPKSGRYWSVANDQMEAGLRRNKLILTSSADLKSWRTEMVLEQNPDDWKVGFQYVDFLFEGDDLIFSSRTAWNGADNFHNANYQTFHRVKNFRTAPSLDAGGGCAAPWSKLATR